MLDGWTERKPRRISSPVDVHVGRRIMTRRLSLGLSRPQVAQAIGLSVEQLRRYESGLATVVASRLLQIGRVLQAPIDYFFAGLPREISGEAASRPQYVTLPPGADRPDRSPVLIELWRARRSGPGWAN